MINTQTDNYKTFWRAASWLLAVGLGLVLWQINTTAETQSLLETSTLWRLGFILAAVLTVGLVLLAGLSFTPWWSVAQAVGDRVQSWLVRLGWINFVGVGLCWLVFFVASFGPGSLVQLFDLSWLRVFLCLECGLGAGIFLRAARPSLPLPALVLVGVVIPASIYQMLYTLPAISDYPFTIAWSEGTWYYYASLFSIRPLYGSTVDFPYSHLTRSLMQAVPFILNDLPLLFHRLWQSLLWLGTPLLTAWLLVRRLKLPNSAQKIVGVGGAYLFISTTPVFYHLLVPVILILWGFDRRRMGRSMLWVAAATIWATLSRINWIPVPGMLAMALWVLETPLSEGESVWRYYRRTLPIVLTAMAFALATFLIYSSVPGSSLTSSLSSPLLRYRLLPNANMDTGLLGGILLASAGLLLALILDAGRLHPARWMVLTLMLGVLGAGGTLVSLKIGGGNNLHNYDAYLVLLLIWGGYILAGKTMSDRTRPQRWLGWVLGIALLIPLGSPLLGNPVFPVRDAVQAAADLATLNVQAQQAVSSGGKVLFISERHLLTFGLVSGIPMQPKYELNLLMEMAMSHNEVFFDQFNADLARHDYALIIVDHLHPVEKKPTEVFAEENNAWLKHVVWPLLKYYQVDRTLGSNNLDLLIPNP